MPISRSKSKPATEVAAPLPQIESYAFTVLGYAFEHKIKNRVKERRITTLPPSSTGYENWDRGRGSRPEIPKDPAATKENEPPNPPHSIQCMVVGLLIANEQDLKTAVKRNKGKPTGNSLDTAVVVHLDRALPEPVYEVVVPIQASEDAAPHTRLYVLAEELDGLCRPYRTNQERVFYFDEFRDHNSTTELRKRGWNQLVRSKAVDKSSKSTAADVASQIEHVRPAKEQTVAVVQHETSFIDQIKVLATALFHTPDSNILMKLIGADLSKKFLKHPFLREFVEGTDLLSEELAKQIISESVTTWPELEESISITNVQLLKRGMLRSKTKLQYAHLKMFLMHGNKVLGQGKGLEGIPPFADEALDSFTSNIVKDVMETVGMFLDNMTYPETMLRGNASNTIITILAERLKDICKANREMFTSFESLVGSHSVASNIAECLEVCRNSTDTDTLKLAFHQGLGYLLNQFLERADVINKPVEELADILSRLDVGSSAAEPETGD